MEKLIIVEAWPSSPPHLFKPLSVAQLDLHLPHLLIKVGLHPRTFPIPTHLLWPPGTKPTRPWNAVPYGPSPLTSHPNARRRPRGQTTSLTRQTLTRLKWEMPTPSLWNPANRKIPRSKRTSHLNLPLRPSQLLGPGLQLRLPALLKSPRIPHLANVPLPRLGGCLLALLRPPGRPH